MKKIKKNFPGPLILIVGNSGSGKDSIIKGAVEKYPTDLREIYLVKRYITRPPSETEDSISVTPQEFKDIANQNRFTLKWNIYGLDYGIPLEIDEWLAKGHPVLANVSRSIIDEAKQNYENLKVVFVKVPLAVSIKRLKERAREKGKYLEERIKRAKQMQDFSKADYIIDNSEKLEYAINQFLNYLIEIEKLSQTIKK